MEYEISLNKGLHKEEIAVITRSDCTEVLTKRVYEETWLIFQHCYKLHAA